MRFLLWYLWIAPHVLLAFALVLLLRRGLNKEFPFFATYVAFQIFDFLTLVTADILVVLDPRHHLNSYRWILVGDTGISSLLSFAVIYELVNRLVLARPTLAKTVRPVMRWAAVALLLVTAVASAHLGVTAERVMHVFELLDFSSSVLQMGLLVALFFFSRILRVSWSAFPFGIAVGLGILGCVDLATAPFFSALGSHRYAAIDAVRLGAFHVCVLVWLGYLIFPEQRPKFEGKPPQEAELEPWNRELQRMVRR